MFNGYPLLSAVTGKAHVSVVHPANYQSTR